MKLNSESSSDAYPKPSDYEETRQEAAERCKLQIDRGFDAEQPVLIDALPATGKSSGVIKWAIENSNLLTVFAARHDLYEDYIEWCEKFGLSRGRVKRLPAFHHDCPTAKGEHGEEWRHEVLNQYGTQSGAKIHNDAMELFDKQLPCQEESQCQYMADREYDGKDYDVLIGHYTHAHSSNPELTDGRFVVFDEFPEDNFLVQFESNRVSRAISNYVRRHDEIPYENVKEVEEKQELTAKYREMVQSWVNITGRKDSIPDDYERLVNADYFASDFFQFELLANRLENRWEYCELGGGRVAVRNPNDSEVTILEPPTNVLEKAQSVIALDGTPTIEKWRLLLGNELQHVSTFPNDKSKRNYLQQGLQLRIIQTTEDAKPYQNRHGNTVTEEKDMELLRLIREREGKSPAVISSKTALNKYHMVGLDHIIEDAETRSEYYGNLKGTNDFSEVRLGVVIGSPQPNDEVIQMWGALAGESIERLKNEDGNRTMGKNIAFSSFGNSLLQGFRENEVLQAAMRFGRREVGGERGATVYVHTGAIPEWVEPEQNIVNFHPWDSKKDGMKKVIEAIKQLDDWQTRKWRADNVEDGINNCYDKEDAITRQAILTHLHTLADYGYIEQRRVSEVGRPWEFENVSLESCRGWGHVGFSVTPEEVA